MSGIKEMTVTMTQTERDRLYNNVRISNETIAQAQRREQEARNALIVAQKQTATLQSRMDNEISGLHSTIKVMSEEQNKRIKEQNERMNEQAVSFNISINDLKKQMKRNNDELKRQMNKNKKELSNYIEKVRKDIEKKEKSKEKIANLWISQAKAFFKDIEKSRHDLFTPGELRELELQLERTTTDMKNQMYESATSDSREVFYKAFKLKDVIANAEMEWSEQFKLYQYMLSTVKSNISSSYEKDFIFNTDSGEKSVDANINYWTNGELNKMRDVVKEIIKQGKEPDKMSTALLKDMTDNLEQINTEVMRLEEKAKEELIASQKRGEMANHLIEVFDAKGWSAKGVTYEGDEQNNPVYVKMSDGCENEFVVVISPDRENANGNGVLGNTIEINHFNESNDLTLNGILISDIAHSMNDNGLKVGSPICREGYMDKTSDNHTARDLRAIKNKTTSK